MWFNKRERQPEVQDQLDLDPSLLHAALRGLDRCNWCSRTANTIWRPIRQLAASRPGEPLRVLDIACGSGQLLVQLGQWARAGGVDLSLSGCDMNPRTVQYARAHAWQAGIPARFFAFDACKDELPDDFDIVMTSTFLHHLSNDQACTLLGRMRDAARQLVIVDDLIRGWVGWALAHLATRGLFTSWVNRVDGPRSVAAAFTVEEIRGLADDAGLTDATLQTHWPARFLLCWQPKVTAPVARAGVAIPMEIGA